MGIQAQDANTYLLETLDFKPLVVQKDLDVSHGTGHVVDSLHQQGFGIIIDFRHSEPRKIRLEGDSRVFLALLVFSDLRTLSAIYNEDDDRSSPTFGSPFLLMLCVKTCLYFFLVLASAVSTTS